MSLYKLKILLIIISISLFINAQAQYNHQLRATWHNGIILKHSPFIKHLIKGPVYGSEINYIRPTNGSKQWHANNNYPDLGIGLSYFYLNNEKELGELYALHAILELYLVRQPKLYVAFRLSPGLTYSSKIFNEQNNYKHNFLGTKMNSYINLRWTYGRHLNEHMDLEIATGIAHTSNGAFQLPNLGINIWTTSLGVKYRLNKTNRLQQSRSIEPLIKKNNYQVHLALGRRVNNRIANEVIQCATASFNYYRSINHTNAIGSGLDIFYRHNTIPNFNFLKLIYEDKQRTFYQFGLKLNYIYRAGNMDFPVDVGVYIIDKYKKNSLIFNRFGMRYHICKNLMTNITLKFHATKADYIEWGIGYDF